MPLDKFSRMVLLDMVPNLALGKTFEVLAFGHQDERSAEWTFTLHRSHLGPARTKARWLFVRRHAVEAVMPLAVAQVMSALHSRQ
jgi:hypothetical protein